MRRLIPLLLLCCVTIPALAQQQRDREFENVVVLIVDADDSIRDEVTESLRKSFSKLAGAEVIIFDSSWSGKSNWVISVSVSLIPGQEKERKFQMGLAFSEAVDVVEAQTLLGRTQRSNNLTSGKLKSEVEKSMRGISDFRAMWLTIGVFPTDIESRCVEASVVFDKNLLGPVRREWLRRKAEEARNNRSSNRRR